MPVIFQYVGTTPSNKTKKYSLQSTAKAYGYNRDDGYKVNIKYPVIDKLSVTFPVDDDDRAAFDEILMDIHKDHSDFQSKTAIGSRYKLNMDWTDQPTGEKVVIQCKPKTAKNYVRFELNPALLGADGMKRFKEMFHLTLSLGNYPYKSIIETGHITRADIAVDMINVPIHDLIIAGKGSGKSVKFIGLAGDLETDYLDKPKDKPSYKKVYNKQKQQSDLNLEEDFGGVHHTRVEYNHKGAEFGKFRSIQNPFKKFKVIHPVIKPKNIDDWIWQLFLNSCRLKGVDRSLELLPDDIRPPCKKALEKARAQTWKPEILWEKWEEYLMSSGVMSED